jgi:hypothetical protein
MRLLKKRKISNIVVLLAATTSLLVLIVLASMSSSKPSTTQNEYSIFYDIQAMRELSLDEIGDKLDKNDSHEYEIMLDLVSYGDEEYSTKELIDKSEYPINTPIDWNWKFAENRSKNYHLHSLDMLNPFLTTHSNTGISEYLDVPFEVLVDWISSNDFEPLNNQDDNFAWYDMAVGVRLYRMSYIFEKAMEAGLGTKAQHSLIWNSIVDHIEYLANDENIIFRNNHGLYQSAGQMAAARRFESISKDFKALRNEANIRFSDMLAEQFTAESVHKEHSPTYHRLIYEMLLSMKKDGLLNEKNQKIVAEVGNVLYWMIKPDGSLNRFGDSDYNVIPRDKNKYYDMESEQLLYYVSNGKEGAIPKEKIKGYEKSGVVSIKDEASYLYFQSAFHSRTHKHADDSSFVWYENEDILIDPGKYGYLGKTKTGDELSLQGFWYSDPYRMYVEGTSAHNTVEIDGKDFLRRKREPFGSGITKYGEGESGVYYAESKVTQFDSVEHARSLIYKPNEWLIVLDKLDDSKNEKHSYKQWFQLASNFNVTPTAGGFFAQSEKNNVYITDATGSSISNGPFVGQKSPAYQGWYSPDVFKIEPSPSINFEREGNDSTFITLFTLDDEEPRIKNVDVDATKGNLTWQVKKSHSLKFDFSGDKAEIIYDVGENL